MNNNSTFFYGVVEAVGTDPLKVFRYKVRVHHHHTTNTTKLPTEALPWAQCILPVTSAGISGVGETPALMIGTTVVGFFADGDNRQIPIILGTLAGVTGTEPDVSSIARRGENTSLIPGVVGRKAALHVGTVNGWTPPVYGWSQSLYPYNHVKTTEGGHVIEIDDTPGHQRYHQYHPSGTSTEIHSNGDNVVQVTGTSYRLVSGSEYMSIAGSTQIIVAGTVLIRGSSITIEGNTTITGNLNVSGRIDAASVYQGGVAVDPLD